MGKENLKIKLSDKEENNLDEEIIFQVKINRSDGSFEFVKKEMSSFEQSAFELFIQTYARTQMEHRLDYFCDDYYDNSEDE